MPESKAQRKARMKAEKKAKLDAKRAAAKDERALREDAERAAEVANAAIKVYVDAAVDEVIGPLITNAIAGALDDAIWLTPAAAPAPAPAPAHAPPKWAVGDVVVCDLRLPVARQIREEKREELEEARGLFVEAQAAAEEKPGDRDAIQALYKAQNRLPDFEEAFQEAEDYVHSLVVSTLSAKDGGVVIVGTVRDIIISDEAQALEEYWDDYAIKEKDLGEILGERPDLLMQARSRLDDVPAWGEQPKLSITEVASQLFASGDMFDVALVEECWKHRNPAAGARGRCARREAEHGRARRGRGHHAECPGRSR